MKNKIFALGLMGLLATTAVFSESYDDHHEHDHGGRLTYLDQHWTSAEREKFYFTPQGSYLIPYTWFLALETPEHEPFNRPNNIRRYGYLVDSKNASAVNPDRIPVGFAKEPTANGEAWLGYTCAACHTNNIQYKHHTVRVDGAPSLSDFTAFNNGLIAALDATLSNERQFNRFARSVLGKVADQDKRTALRQQVTDHVTWLKGFAQRGKSTHAYGAGRVDAFGIIMNEVFGRDLGQADNLHEPNAPVSYPFLWGTPQHDYVQWFGSAYNPYGRNVGEVLGTFGEVNLNVTSPEFGSNTARARELFELERLVAKLGSPIWPEALFGKIDRDRAARGRMLYTQSHNGEESCADCHALPDSNGQYPSTPAAENLYGVTFVKTHMTPLADIGTDPLTSENFALRKVNPGAVAPILPAPFTNASEVPAPVMLTILAGVAVKNSITVAQPPFTAAETAELFGYRFKAANLPPYAPPNLLAYRARPLEGIWATAPYLHNGSVPSLHELLLPPAERRQIFYVGSMEFDPEEVGFKSTRSRKTFRFDTSLPGNRNSGHTYGTTLNDEERRDLLEFLKTL